jgi:hypothetical protein
MSCLLFETKYFGFRCNYSLLGLRNILIYLLPPRSAFAVVLYGCLAGSPILKENHKQKIFENRVQRRIYGPKMHGREGRSENLMKKFKPPHLWYMKSYTSKV